MRTRPLAVVLMSGGLDSCVTAAVARRDFDLALCHANYGQRTVARELSAFRAQAAFFRVDLVLEADLSFLGQIGGSSLTDRSQAVPAEGDVPGIPSTYVPCRNSLLLGAAAAWAEVLGAPAIFIGANVLDDPGYPDCRPAYFEAFNRVLDLGTRPETHLQIKTPLMVLSMNIRLIRDMLKTDNVSVCLDEMEGVYPSIAEPMETVRDKYRKIKEVSDGSGGTIYEIQEKKG